MSALITSTPVSTRVTIPDEVHFRDFGDEAVILELSTGQYFGLDEVGTRMWLRLREHGRIEDAFQTLLEEYQVPEDQLRHDLLEFIDRLAQRQLVKLHVA